MKKIFTLLVLLAIVVIATNYKSTTVNALEDNTAYNLISTSKTQLDDGTYMIISIYDSINTSRANVFTKNGQAVATNYNSSDEVLWTYTLNATYEVNTGISAVCTSANYVIDINDSNWKFSDGNAYYSSNVAYGVGVFKHKILFITTQTVNIDLALTCDVNGNLS